MTEREPSLKSLLKLVSNVQQRLREHMAVSNDSETLVLDLEKFLPLRDSGGNADLCLAASLYVFIYIE